MPRLTDEEKALLARILEGDDDEVEEPEPDQPSDEFTYQGKRYVYTPEELEQVQEEAPPAPVKKAPVKKPSANRVADKQPEPDPSPEDTRRRFHT